MEMSEEQLVIRLYEVGGLKFGNFTMRTGESSPVYVDMRVIWSYPDIVVIISEMVWKKVRQVLHSEKSLELPDDLWVCGIPYQGIPLASYMCTKYGARMLLYRQSPKQYGTCRLIEGNYKKGDRVVLVDDVLMTGGTLVQDIPIMEKEGLNVEFAVVFIDREQGASTKIKRTFGKDVHSVLGLHRIFEILCSAGKIDQQTVDTTLEYLRTNQFST